MTCEKCGIDCRRMPETDPFTRVVNQYVGARQRNTELEDMVKDRNEKIRILEAQQKRLIDRGAEVEWERNALRVKSDFYDLSGQLTKSEALVANLRSEAFRMRGRIDNLIQSVADYQNQVARNTIQRQKLHDIKEVLKR